MQQRGRRTFILQLAVGTSTIALATRVAAEDERVTETDPYARSMGFRVDTSQVDQARYPRHATDQHCSKCQLFSGKAGEPLGPCSFYGGRLVPINGWCRNFKAKKA
jgi:hypothetical protein